MKKIMIINGYIWIALIPIVIWRFQQDGTVNTKWGRFSGASARDALIGYCLLSALFGYYSIKESISYFKERKEQNDQKEL